MARAPFLVSLALLGAAAVGTLVVLEGEGVRGPRAERQATARGPRPRRVATPARVVRPAVHEPPTAAGPRPGVDAEELVSAMVRPDLSLSERMAKAREIKRVLRGRAPPALRERLLEMLETADPCFRDPIADVLGSLEGDVETARALVGLWKAAPEGDAARGAILEALSRMEVGDVTPSLLASLGAGDPDEPLVIRTIGKLATPSELEQLLDRLDQPLGAASRTAIEQVLEERGGLYDKVAAALDGAKLKERRSLLRILSSSTDPRHAAAMRDLLGRRIDPDSRGIVIRALGMHGDAESGRALLGLLERGSAEDRLDASRALSSVRNPDTVTLLAADWRRLDGEGRTALLGAMARLPAPTDAMTVIAREGLLDPEPRVRASAALVLGERGRDENVDALARFLERSTEPAESTAALTALDGIGTRKAALAAIPRLDSVRDGIRRDRWRRRFERILDGEDA